jgi:hypothetical protein
MCGEDGEHGASVVALVRAGVVPALVVASERHVAVDAGVAEWLCRALLSVFGAAHGLAVHELDPAAVRRAVVDAGGVAVVVECVVRHGRCHAVVHATATLWALAAIGPHVQINIVAAGGVEALVAVVGAPACSEAVASHCCHALWSVLTTSTDARRRLLHCDGIAALVGVLARGVAAVSSSRWRDATGAPLAAVCGALRNAVLEREDSAGVAVACGVVGHIARAMGLFPHSAAVQLQGCGAVWAVAAGAAAAAAPTEDEVGAAVAAIVAGRSEFPTDVDIATTALNALKALGFER